MLSAAPKVAAAEGVSLTVGIPGAGTAGMIGAILSKPRIPVIVAADNMIASPAFTRAITKAIQGDTSTANKIIENSAAFKAWIKTLPTQDASKIARIGFIEWVTDDGR